MRPLVFGQTIGWLHEAGGRRGVVIAGAHGFEDLCSRRFLTLLARRIAAAGLPALQFDYPGCGDAAGDHAESGRVAAWVDSIGAAADRLKRETGVEEIVIVGFRLGALLAPLAAAGRDDMAGLALLAPPVSGKAYVREMTALSRMIDAPLAAKGGPAEPFDGRQIAGFHLSSETLAALSELDWQQALAEVRAPHMLVLANGKLPNLEVLRSERGGMVPEVAVAEFEGYVHLVCDPTANRIPEPMLDLAAGWVGPLVMDGGDRAATGASGSQILMGPDYSEEPVVIGGGSEICGVLCRPAIRTAPATPVIFLNAGAVPHVGWARGTVEAARALAAEGVASLRIDLPGLGQSAAPDQDRLFLYDSRTGGDVGRAIDWMGEAGFGEVALVGTCSGAFQAFHTARVDRRVRRLTMINPLCFAWNKSYALDLAVWKVYENSKAQGQGGDAMQEPSLPGTGELLRSGAVKLVRRSIRRGLELIKTALAVPDRLVRRSPVERWMRSLCTRGVRVLMVTSEGDLSLEEIARHFGPGGVRLGAIRGVARLSLAAADHTLTPYHARRALIARLIDFGHDDDQAAREFTRDVKAPSARPIFETP